MRKITLVMMLIVTFVLVLACASQSPATTEEALKKVYERYFKDLILDGADTYTVSSGDTLSAISRRVYQDGFYFPVIMLASKDVVTDPDKIEPGMKLTIPDLQKNLDSPRARANIKSYLKDIAAIEDDRNRPQDAEGLRKLADSL
jgi:hypothetical protein